MKSNTVDNAALELWLDREIEMFTSTSQNRPELIQFMELSQLKGAEIGFMKVNQARIISEGKMEAHGVMIRLTFLSINLVYLAVTRYVFHEPLVF